MNQRAARLLTLEGSVEELRQLQHKILAFTDDNEVSPVDQQKICHEIAKIADQLDGRRHRLSIAINKKEVRR